jgi:signal peptidase I
LIALAIGMTAAVLFGTVLFQTYSYDDSMQPTIQPGDWLIGLNASIVGPIHRNELWEVNWGGLVGTVRVVGLPGDRVQIRNGILVLNGERVREPYCDPYSGPSGDFPLPSEAYSEELLRMYHEGAYGDKLNRATEYVVPNNSYFVLNDDRKQLSDSRTMGPVRREGFIDKLVIACRASGSVFDVCRLVTSRRISVHTN